MAFQRPFLISLKRAEPRQRWGFGINGGKDYDHPLIIQTVAEDSVAERCGLRRGDEVIQVGRVNVQDLSLGQVQELLARCGNKIEMFVIREDLLTPRKGKEPPVVKAVVHNPYNSPLSLYSTENIADTLGRQTEVLTEGQISTDEEDGPENLSFKQKSAVFQLLEQQEQANQGSPTRVSRGSPQSTVVRKPKAAPPPPPKPKPPSDQQLYNGYDTSHLQQYNPSQGYQDQKHTSRVEFRTTEKVVNQYQYQQEQPHQYQQSSVYQSSYQQQSPGYQSPVSNYQQNYQQINQSNYQRPQSPRSPVNYQQTYQRPQSPRSPVSYQQNYQRPQSPRPAVSHQQDYQQVSKTSVSSNYQQPSNQSYQPLNQVNYQQSQQQQKRREHSNTQSSTNQQQSVYQSEQPEKTLVSKTEFKIGPPPPPRGSSAQKDTSNMTAIYRQQYEQHLQQQHEQQQYYANQLQDDDYQEKHKAHIITGDIFENNTSAGTPITYKAPPAAPPKPNWPPPNPQQNDMWKQSPTPSSPSGMRSTVASVWPPKKPAVTELPRTGFNPAAVREQGTGRRCVWPPQRPEDEIRSGRTTPQSPMTGRRINWNPSPSPPSSRRVVFGSSQSPSRRKDIVWPPPSPTHISNGKENYPIPSPRLSRRAKFDDYVKEHASNNIPQTYRPAPGTQHVEFC